MKNKRGIVFFLTAVLTAATLGNVTAQQGAAPAAPPNPVRTVVVDMVVLLRAHPKLNADLKSFNTQQLAIRDQLMSAEKNLQDEAKIVTESSRRAGTPEYNQAMEELEKRMVELRAAQNKAQREAMHSDMKIKYEAFKTIEEEIQRFSVANGIAVVLDVRGIDPEQDDLTNAQEVVGQTVVWSAQGVNITTRIVQLLNQRFQQFPPTANIVTGNDGKPQVVFLETNNNGMGTGPAVPQRPAPGQQPVAGPGQPGPRL